MGARELAEKDTVFGMGLTWPKRDSSRRECLRRESLGLPCLGLCAVVWNLGNRGLRRAVCVAPLSFNTAHKQHHLSLLRRACQRGRGQDCAASCRAVVCSECNKQWSSCLPLSRFAGESSERVPISDGETGNLGHDVQTQSRQPGLQPLCLYVCVSERVCLDTDKTPREANSGR